MERRSSPSRVAFQQLKMPEVGYVDGMSVPNYENRDPAPKYQLPFEVNDAMKFIQIPAEYSLSLFATEPEIVKPIAFAFDERGRMWIAETVDYPNEPLGGKPGDDRIRIIEDTNGDGRADKFTLFADHLNIPTSIVFGNGGLIVAQPPHILFLKDTDGDDKADERKILSTGWGQTDTHATLSNLQYGMDNYIWGVVGYSGFKGEINGKQFAFAQAAFRFKPDGSDFEVMTGSTNNTWGLGFSETFDVFGSTANNDPSWNMAIANRYFDGIEGLPTPGQRGVGSGYQSIAAFYAVHPLTPYIRQVDVFNGYTAGAGHYLYTARSFPKEYWNRVAFINEPTAHVIGQGIVEKQGAGFVTRDGWNLAAGAEEWFAPVHTQVGPDGAVWFSDWYNFIIQHNPTPQGFSNGAGNAYESQLRDHRRGRIYRVAYKNAPVAPKRSLSKTDTAGPARSARLRQHAVAVVGAAAARRARTEGRRAAAAGAREEHDHGCHRHQRRRHARAVDAQESRRNRCADEQLVRDRGRGAEASRRRSPQGSDDGVAEDGRRGKGDAGGQRAPGSGSADAAGGYSRPFRNARVSGHLAGALSRESEGRELRRPLAEPRVLHRGAATQDDVHDSVQGRQGGAALRLAADCAAARRAQAGLAPAGSEGRHDGLERDAGPRQLGVARPARLRRRRLVYAHYRCSGCGGDRRDVAVARRDAQHG